MQESASFLGSWGDFERTSFLARLQEDLSYSLRELFFITSAGQLGPVDSGQPIVNIHKVSFGEVQ